MREISQSAQLLRSHQNLYFSLQILTRDQVHHLNAIRQQSEQQPEINSNPMAQDAGACFKPNRADKGCRFTRRQASQHRHRAAGYLTRELAEMRMKVARKLDEAHPLVSIQLLRQHELFLAIIAESILRRDGRHGIRLRTGMYLGRIGNPTTRNLFAVTKAICGDLGIKSQLKMAA